MKNINLLYGDIVYILLEKIAMGLKFCAEIENFDNLVPSNDDFLNIFLDLKNIDPFKGYINNGINSHIIEGLPDKHREVYKIYPRIARLIIQAFKEAKETEESSTTYRGKVLPSPLYVLKQLLTVPKEPQSEAYASYVCRILLYDFYKISLFDQNETLSFEDEDIRRFASSFRKYLDIQGRWPRWNDSFPNKITKNDQKKLFFGHFLSMKGYFGLWFDDAKSIVEYLEKYKNSSIDVIFNKSHHFFRLLSKYQRPPDDGEIINLATGIPLPIFGADIVFQGGLKKASNSGLVVSLNGSPGIGKTSVALALAASLSPLNTKSLYISLEEGIEDLESRLLSIIPEYIKDLSIFKNYNTKKHFDWFIPIEAKNSTIEDFTDKILKTIRERLYDTIHTVNRKTRHERKIIPCVCPALIVIDNINELLIKNSTISESTFYQQLENFIHECRKLKALIIIVSGDKMPQDSKFEYLVDVLINMEYKGTGDLDEKPYRLLHLIKTRHQLSRIGSHVFHLSGLRGFRIAPQVSSQIDKKEILKRPLVKDQEIINTLNVTKDDNLEKFIFDKKVDIFPNSQILIHGSGSGGKAGFALKLLLTPPLSKNLLNELGSGGNFSNFIKEKPIDFSLYRFRRKILVVSFLYPEKYYEELVYDSRINIEKTISTCYRGLQKPVMHVLSFFPGYLAPEDLINKVTRLLDIAILDGEPYNGILLDGMHNVFLQFKKLQERDMVWPLLYSILPRYNLTIATTFTNFSFNTGISQSLNNVEKYLSPDYLYMQKGQTPFLHIVVKGNDHYFIVEECKVKIEQDNAAPRIVSQYIIKPIMSVKQEFAPDTYLVWDKQKSIIKKFEGKILA